MSLSLPERLKTETRALHTAAERSTFMGLLLRGHMERPAYCALLRNLHAIYVALEAALLRHADHPLISPVFLPALWRAPSLERDLLVMHGAEWRDEIPLQPAAARHANRLSGLSAGAAGLLLAHAYVRYLGDLSGGQVLGSIVSKSLSAPGACSVAFYDFGDAASTRETTRAFRAGLASVVVDAAGLQRLVDEARLAFELHCELFDQLAVACGLVAPQESNSRM